MGVELHCYIVNVIRETESICPECLSQLKATVYEEDGKVFIEKTCKTHGRFKDIYWSDHELYKWAASYTCEGTPIYNPRTRFKEPCFFNCGLCDNHKSHTVLAIIDVTSRCNIRCPGCFAAAGNSEYVYEPTLEQIEYMLKNLRQNEPVAPTALQLSGGEPTVRDDLPDIIRMAKKVGFKHVEVNTNGIRLAKDIEYFKELIEAGMSTIYLQFDSVKPKAIIEMRGANILPYKLQVIENARKLGLQSIVLVVTLAKSVNDKDLGDIIDFAIKNSDVIRCVNVQPISFSGRGAELDPTRYRITISDFMKLVEEQTNGKIKVSDFRPIPWAVPIAKAIGALKGKYYHEFSTAPWCGVATFLIPKNNGEYVPITRVADVDKFREAMLKVYKHAKKGQMFRAKLRLLFSLRYAKFSLLKGLLWRVLKEGTYEALGNLMRRLVMIGCMHFMDRWNMDMYRLQRCTIHYATPDPEHPIIPFCSYNNYWRPIIERKFARKIAIAVASSPKT